MHKLDLTCRDREFLFNGGKNIRLQRAGNSSATPRSNQALIRRPISQFQKWENEVNRQCDVKTYLKLRKCGNCYRAICQFHNALHWEGLDGRTFTCAIDLFCEIRVRLHGCAQTKRHAYLSCQRRLRHMRVRSLHISNASTACDFGTQQPPHPARRSAGPLKRQNCRNAALRFNRFDLIQQAGGHAGADRRPSPINHCLPSHCPPSLP